MSREFTQSQLDDARERYMSNVLISSLSEKDQDNIQRMLDRLKPEAVQRAKELRRAKAAEQSKQTRMAKLEKLAQARAAFCNDLSTQLRLRIPELTKLSEAHAQEAARKSAERQRRQLLGVQEGGQGEAGECAETDESEGEEDSEAES